MTTSVPQNLAEETADDAPETSARLYGWLAPYVDAAMGDLYSEDDWAERVGRTKLAAEFLKDLPAALAGKVLEKEFVLAEEQGRDPDIGNACRYAIQAIVEDVVVGPR